jgi:thiamine-phosphate pyrophosphorylase
MLAGLHVLIDPGRVPAARLPEFLEDIAGAGAAVVQIRIKEGTTRAALAYGSAVMRVKDRHPALTVIVNDRVDWALALHADGVHLGQDDMPLPLARRIAPHLLVGVSAGSHAELREIVPLRPDYIGLGPVYATPSKADAGDPLGLEQFRTLRLAVPREIPVVAIGGIMPTNAGLVWQAGADGLAVIQAVAGAEKPGEAVRALLAARRSEGRRER